MTWERGRASVERLITDGRLETISGAAADGAPWLDSATALLNSARREAPNNPEAAYLLAYDAARKATPSPVTENIIAEFRAKQGITPRKISDEEILERCLYPMINEGAKILEEGKAIRASDIDIVWINGYGWPVYRGGPMYYGDQIGLDKVLAKMRVWHASMGEDFKPAALLEKLAAEGKKFQGLK